MHLKRMDKKKGKRLVVTQRFIEAKHGKWKGDRRFMINNTIAAPRYKVKMTTLQSEERYDGERWWSSWWANTASCHCYRYVVQTSLVSWLIAFTIYGDSCLSESVGHGFNCIACCILLLSSPHSLWCCIFLIVVSCWQVKSKLLLLATVNTKPTLMLSCHS